MTDAPLVDSARIFALIPAAGVGRRMGADCPKQYMPIAGVPMLVRTVEALLAASRVERVFVVVSPEDAYIDHAAESFAKWGDRVKILRAGWLGKIGFIQAQGENLFETLMLNLTLLQDGQSMWGENLPCWELDVPRSAERTQILCPDNPAQLLTLQSRRLLLHRENDMVDRFYLLGGDFFQRETATAEQMTIWRNTAKKNEAAVFAPIRHDPAKQFKVVIC